MGAAPRIVIVGGGIAGASLAWTLAVRRGVAPLLLERETQCGQHSTGRSAALYMPSYGPPAVRAATRASGAFYRSPPAGFATQPLLSARGALHVALADDADAAARLAALRAQLAMAGAPARELDAAACLTRCPVLRPELVRGGLLEDEALDMDVDAILQGFLRGARTAGVEVRGDAEVLDVARTGGAWRLRTRAGTIDADVVVDAAGAWADALARLAGVAPIGLQPKRRSAFLFDAPAVDGWRDWPTVIDLAERFYFKPDAGCLLGSPANADAVEPHDVQPEEFDVASGIWAIEQATTLSIRRPRATWAGLRSFVADGEPVVGFDPRADGWFWLAGQGGYGIQSAPGLAQAAASLLLDGTLDAPLLDAGLRAEAIAPGRG